MMNEATEALRTQSLCRTRFSVVSVPRWLCTLIAIATCELVLQAHSGPPFPIVQDRIVGAYKVSIWTDPDATDDQTAAGKFWITVQPAVRGAAVPDGTRVQVSIAPLDRAGAERTAHAERLNADVQRQFAALVMDHEGRYGVHVQIDGPLGTADVESQADATYDLRPRPILTLVFVAPFLLVGFVWGKLLITRTMAARGRGGR
jgi:hypothetical protein